MTDQPTSDDVIDALRAAGWLLEQDTASTLDAHGFRTIMGRAFQDPDDPQVSREIDVWAHRELFRDDELNLVCWAYVIAECKQSSNPYAFIGRHMPPEFVRGHPTEHLLRYEYIEQDGEQLGPGSRRIHHHPAWQWLGLNDVPGSPATETFRAVQMTRLDRQKTWKADNRGIFTSLVHPLAKALRALQQPFRPVRGRVEHGTDSRQAQVCLFFPVVVTSAPLYVVDATATPVEAVVRPWVTMTRSLQSKSLTGRFDVDVVNYEHLDDWLISRVGAFTEGVTALMRADPRRFVTMKIPPSPENETA